MTIRLLRKEDVPEVAQIEKMCFPDPWSEASLAECLFVPPAKAFCIVNDEEKIVAYAGMYCVLDEGQIVNIATHPSYRRRGYAQMMIQKLKEEALVAGLLFLTLEVRASNQAAIELYEKNGFAVIGERANYYLHPRENALIMNCNLKDG